MKGYKGMATLALLCLSIPIIILAMIDGETSDDKPSSSRWADVDLTKYCGKTIRELIDALGHDYDYFQVISTFPHKYVSTFSFIYDDFIELLIDSDYIEDPESYQWQYKDIETMRIQGIEVIVYASTGRSMKP